METTKKMTKKAFKDLCSFTAFTGRGVKFNAIYFDWREPTYTDNDNQRGWKYGITANVKSINKKELFDIFYNWINDMNDSKLTILRKMYTYIRYAETDQQRFKSPISLNLDSWQ